MSKRFADASAHPLSWPDGFPRTKQREDSRFDTSLFKALANVQDELARFAKDSQKKLDEIVISSNYSLTETRPADPGVAVYFTWDGERTCIPVDRYTLVEDNLQAIYRCIEAKRTMLRHGGINLVKAAFRGYAALPDPNALDWREVLDYAGNDIEEAKKRYRAAIRLAHPDRGGNDAQAARINAAMRLCEQELRG